MVHMKDGQIYHQSTQDDIREENPDLVVSWSTTPTEKENQDSEAQDAVLERAKLEEQISQIEEKQKQDELARKDPWSLPVAVRNNPTWSPDYDKKK